MIKQKRSKRVTAFILSCALALTFLPTNVLASFNRPSVGGGAPTTWETNGYIKYGESEWTQTSLKDYEGFKSSVMSTLTQLKDALDKDTSVGTSGNTYRGFGSTEMVDGHKKVSGTYVTENFLKYLTAYSWAQYNYLVKEGNDWNYYNAFVNNTSGGVNVVPLNPEDDTIGSYIAQFKECFETNGMNKLNDFANFSTTSIPADWGTTFSKEYAVSAIYVLINQYLSFQVLAQLSQELDQTTLDDLSSGGKTIGDLTSALQDHFKAQQTTGGETGGENGGAGGESPAKQEFRNTIAADKTLIIGDSVAYNVMSSAFNVTYPAEEGSISCGLTFKNTGADGVPYYIVRDDRPQEYYSPNFISEDSYTMSLTDGSFDCSSVDEVYVMYGRDWVTLRASQAENPDEDFSFSETYDTESYNAVTAFIGRIIRGINGDNTNPNMGLKIRISTIPYAGLDPTTRRYAEMYNDAIRGYVKDNAATLPNVEVVDISVDTVGDEPVEVQPFDEYASSYWNSISQKIVGTTTPGGATQTPPSVIGDSGLSVAQLKQLYNDAKYHDKIKPFFDVYSHVITYAESLSGVHYSKPNAGEVGEGYIPYYYAHFPSTSSIYAGNTIFMDLYEYGYKEADAGQTAPTNPGESVDLGTVETAKSALDLISNADINAFHEVYIQDGADSIIMKDVGYLALAAGVVYDPFVSVAGNDIYLETLRYCCDGVEDEKFQIIQRFLQQAVNTKKPLYVMDSDRDSFLKEKSLEEAPSGDYRYAMLADVLQHDVMKTRIYTVMKGGMAPSNVDGNTWTYAEGTDSKTPPANSATTPNGSNEPSDNGATIQSNSAKVSSVGGVKVMATGQQMAPPVMITSGTKSAMFTGNMAGSASGYAASVGGLTTTILHNAAQDAKSNKYLQDAETYMLFMNGLGDIVLSDGTIILPAIANPIIYNYGDSIQYNVDSSSSIWTIFGTVVGIAGGVAIAIATGGTTIPVLLGIGAGAAGGVVGSAAGGVVLDGITSTIFNGNAPDAVKEVYNSTMGYYPYTVAFMNHYPSAIINHSGNLAVTNPNDQGKYMIGIDSAGNVLSRRINSLNNKSQVNLNYSGGGITTAQIQGLSLNVSSGVDYLGTAVPYYGGEEGTFGSKFNTAYKFSYFMVKDTVVTSDGQDMLPLSSGAADVMDSYLEKAGPLVTSARRFLQARNPTGTTTEAFEGFRVDHYIRNMCGQGLMGTQYGETLQKNAQISYEDLVNDTGNRLLVFFTQLVESAVDNLGKIDGVLAIKNCYENSFFNLIVQFIQEFYLLIAVVLLIIVAVKFLKGHYNFLFVAFIGLMCVCGFEVYANWMPTVVPSLYNFAVNDAIEQIVWNTVTVSAENYEETYKDSNRKDASTGALKPYTATMTLYKMTQSDMMDVAARLGTDYKSLKKGEIHYLDESAGIFVQGDAIKISVDKLLVNNTIRGLHQSQWEQLDSEFTSSEGFITPITTDADMIGNPYSVQLTEPYVSLEAYYMPFNEIERAFMINLNAFASIFRMERNQFSYARGLYKDAFLFNCFTNSGIFTSPGDKDILLNNVKVGSVYATGATEQEKNEAFFSRVYGNDVQEGVFAVPEDWLNAAAVFRTPSENMKTSLWGKMMQDREWYDDDWNITDPEALADLIAYMNTQTKQFVIANRNQLNFCSDENAIKIVSLYATTTFTHYVSQIGKWLYPNYLNAADIELRDVLYGSMTTLRDRNIASDGTAVNTVAKNLGVFGVIFLLLITIFATLFVFVMTYLVPILYALFGGILIFKLINDKDGVGLIKGYVKVTLTTCILYFIFSISLRLVEIGGYAWYGYLGCALVMALCCYFLFWVVLSVVTNIGEMGNEVLGQNLLRGLDSITRGAVRKLTTNTLMARRGIRGYGGYGMGGYGYGMPYQYGRGYGIDSRDYVRGSRSAYSRGINASDYGYGSYGRGASYDESMYSREGRRGLTGVIDGIQFRTSGRRARGVERSAYERTHGYGRSRTRGSSTQASKANFTGQ